MKPTAEVRPASARAPRQKLLVLPFSLLLGGLLAIGHFRQGEVDRAIVVLVLFPAVGMYVAFSKSHLARSSTEPGDEREQMIQRQAAAYAYHALTWLAVAGFIWETYTKEPGEPPGAFTLMAVVGAVTYVASTTVLRRRR